MSEAADPRLVEAVAEFIREFDLASGWTFPDFMATVLVEHDHLLPMECLRQANDRIDALAFGLVVRLGLKK